MRISSLLCLGVVATLAIARTASAQSSACRPADWYGPSLVKELQQIVTTTNAAEIAARESFYKVPVVSATMITLVTKASICSKAATALTKFERSREPVIATTGTAAKPPSTAGAPSSRTVVVVKHDTFWAVQDPSRSPNGRLLTTVIFDARWRMVGGYSGP